MGLGPHQTAVAQLTGLTCRPALELEALVWVSQWQDPLHVEEGRAESPGSEDTRSPDTCGSWLSEGAREVWTLTNWQQMAP